MKEFRGRERMLSRTGLPSVTTQRPGARPFKVGTLSSEALPKWGADDGGRAGAGPLCDLRAAEAELYYRGASQPAYNTWRQTHLRQKPQQAFSVQSRFGR